MAGMRYIIALLILAAGCDTIDSLDLDGNDVGDHGTQVRQVTMTWSARNSLLRTVQWDMRAGDGETWTRRVPAREGDIVGALELTIECRDGMLVCSTFNAAPDAVPYDWRNPTAGECHVCGAGNVLLRW